MARAPLTVRRIAEEIAVDLAAARCLGRLDDMSASLLPMTVAAFVYSLAEAAPAPLLTLSEHRFPALDLLGPGRPLLWGLSYRFTRSLGALVDGDRGPR